MLLVTQNAADALDAVLASAPVTDDFGIRITRRVDTDGHPGDFTLALVDQPLPSDYIIDIEGNHAPLYIDADFAPALEDKVLDAHVENGELGFVIAEQQ